MTSTVMIYYAPRSEIIYRENCYYILDWCIVPIHKYNRARQQARAEGKD